MPYKIPEHRPKRITGPAILKILAPTPKINPSLDESIASETTAFENPVTGTSVPAPAYFAILSNIPNPVRTAAINIRIRVTAIEEVSSLTESSELKK